MFRKFKRCEGYIRFWGEVCDIEGVSQILDKACRDLFLSFECLYRLNSTLVCISKIINYIKLFRTNNNNIYLVINIYLLNPIKHSYNAVLH